jgi:hypothetical protein
MSTQKSIGGPLFAAKDEFVLERFAIYERARRAAGEALRQLRAETRSPSGAPAIWGGKVHAQAPSRGSMKRRSAA